MYSRRTNIHKHLMTVMAAIHISIIILAVQQLVFPLMTGKYQYSWCNLQTPLSWGFYLFTNFTFFIIFFKFWTHNSDYYMSKFISKSYNQYDLCIKLLLIFPFLIILMKYGGQNVCETRNTRSGVSHSYQNDFMAQHLVLELTLLKLYQNWFLREIQNYADGEASSGVGSSLKKRQVDSNLNSSCKV